MIRAPVRGTAAFQNLAATSAQRICDIGGVGRRAALVVDNTEFLRSAPSRSIVLEEILSVAL